MAHGFNITKAAITNLQLLLILYRFNIEISLWFAHPPSLFRLLSALTITISMFRFGLTLICNWYNLPRNANWTGAWLFKPMAYHAKGFARQQGSRVHPDE
jgi:hypothetical protein